MRLNEFISILSQLNKGTVIYLNDDSESEIVLGEASFKLYHSNSKYYFLSEYKDNFNDVESNIQNNQIYKSKKDIRPQDSYLLLFYKIAEFNDAVSKKIIQLEENEFFYKKYVFYYTEEELKSFKDWFETRNDRALSDILKNEDCTPTSGELYIQFLLRLIIKVPFLHLEFKKMELENFDVLLSGQLDRIRNNKDEINKMYKRLSEELENFSPEEIAKKLYEDISRGDKDEN